MSKEPVHGAVLQARMDDLRNGHRDAFDAREALAHAETAPAAPVHAGRIRALRLRVGRTLVAFGAFVEGPCDCPEGATGVGAA